MSAPVAEIIPQPLTNQDVRLLIEEYKFERVLSRHQTKLLRALEELYARRMGEWICPRCHLRQDGPRGEALF